MPRIEITDHDYSRLQGYAEAFVDTPATALTKALDLLEGQKVENDGCTPTVVDAQQLAICYGPTSLPPLTHTKVVSGRLGEMEPDKANWDGMVRLALCALFEKYHDVSEVRRRSGANVVKGEKYDEGYKPLEGLGFSFQGVSAKDAVKILLRAARDLSVSLEIEFVWREKPDAFKPGQSGRIVI